MCPISRELMDDPVMCTDGHSYDRKNIARWLTEHNTSPATGAPLASNVLLPNIALRNAIEEWEDAQQQWERQQREQEQREQQQQRGHGDGAPQLLRLQPPPEPAERNLDPGGTSPSTSLAVSPTSPQDMDVVGAGSSGGGGSGDVGNGGDRDGSGYDVDGGGGGSGEGDAGGDCAGGCGRSSPSKLHGEALEHNEPLEVGSPVLYTDSHGAEQRAQVRHISCHLPPARTTSHHEAEERAQVLTTPLTDGS